MSWVTVIWSIGAGACLTLAFLQFIVWWKDRTARANLVFSIGAVAVAVFAALEFALMQAETPEAFARVTRWIHVPGWVLIVSIVAFVRLYLNAGRRWLAWTIVAVRTLSLILNFVLSPNINYREITSLRHVRFLGESVSIPNGVPNPWMLVAQFSLLLLVIRGGCSNYRVATGQPPAGADSWRQHCIASRSGECASGGDDVGTSVDAANRERVLFNFRGRDGIRVELRSHPRC
jgi:hypothetical protein